MAWVVPSRIVFDVVIGIAIYFWAFKNTITQSNQEFLKKTTHEERIENES